MHDLAQGNIFRTYICIHILQNEPTMLQDVMQLLIVCYLFCWLICPALRNITRYRKEEQKQLFNYLVNLNLHVLFTWRIGLLSLLALLYNLYNNNMGSWQRKGTYIAHTFISYSMRHLCSLQHLSNALEIRLSIMESQ